MSGNYPDGVTGNEYAIAGPDREWEEQRACPICPGEDHLFLICTYRGEAWGFAAEHGDDSVDLDLTD